MMSALLKNHSLPTFLAGRAPEQTQRFMVASVTPKIKAVVCRFKTAGSLSQFEIIIDLLIKIHLFELKFTRSDDKMVAEQAMPC